MDRGLRRLDGPIVSDWATSFEAWGKNARAEAMIHLFEIEIKFLNGDEMVECTASTTIAFNGIVR
ncbi:hypothetical protein N8766_02770 [bacterium]|nr:hypothetical protein [bacterium]